MPGGPRHTLGPAKLSTGRRLDPQPPCRYASASRKATSSPVTWIRQRSRSPLPLGFARRGPRLPAPDSREFRGLRKMAAAMEMANPGGGAGSERSMASEMSKNVKVSGDQESTSQMAPLARQSSILSLTLEELQKSLYEPGRNVGSMNMDEFMANIWNAEEFHAATGGCKEAMEEVVVAGAGGSGDGGAGGSGLCTRQGSFSLPPPLCRKTAEEVWAEINQGPAHAQAQSPPPQPLVQPQMWSGGGVAANGRKVTLGEMTLEDFLVKAGVVRGSFAGQAAMAVGIVHGPMNPMQQRQPGMAVVPPPPPAKGAVAVVSPGSSDGMSAMTQADMMNCINNGAILESGTRKRGLSEDGSAEKTVEHCQRRMIKNRESAARSRARKQPATVFSAISFQLSAEPITT